MIGYRIHSTLMTDTDLHDGHTSLLWTETGEAETDRPRSGLSVTRSMESLVSYFTGGYGVSIGRGADLRDVYVVVIEGEESGDEPFEGHDVESLIHPTKILSAVPVLGSEFLALLKDSINADNTAPAGYEYAYCPRLDDWRIVNVVYRATQELVDFIVDDDTDDLTLEEFNAEVQRVLDFWVTRPDLVSPRIKQLIADRS
jgi:hypothetical protein